jgi:hypothetical protein
MLKGQWFGPYAGTHSGNIIAEFDEIGGDLVGTVTAYPGDSVPPAFTEVRIPTGRESKRSCRYNRLTSVPGTQCHGR